MPCKCKKDGAASNKRKREEDKSEIELDDFDFDLEKIAALRMNKSIRIELKDVLRSGTVGKEDSDGKPGMQGEDEMEKDDDDIELVRVTDKNDIPIDVITLESDEEEEPIK